MDDQPAVDPEHRPPRRSATAGGSRHNVSGSARSSQAFPENCNEEVHPNIFNSVTPRVHAAFDVTGDGRSVIKGGYGRFVHLRSTGAEINNFNKNGQRTMTYDWHDLNGDRDYDPGEVNLDPNGVDFRSGGAQLNAFLNPDENIPGAEEYSIAFERQLTQTVAVRVSGVYLKNYNINRNLNPLRPYEVVHHSDLEPDPGPDGVNNTSDDTGQTLTYWDYPAVVPRGKLRGNQARQRRPEERLYLQDDRSCRDQAALERLAVPGVVLGDEEARSICRRFGVDSERRNQHRR